MKTEPKTFTAAKNFTFGRSYKKGDEIEPRHIDRILALDQATNKKHIVGAKPAVDGGK